MINPFKTEASLLLERGLITEAEYIVMRSDGRFSRAIVVSAVLMISLYALVMMQFTYLNIQNHTNVFPPVEFTTGYFAFWTVEIIMLSSIKKHKIKNKHEDDSPNIIEGVLERIYHKDNETGKDEGRDDAVSEAQPEEPESPEAMQDQLNDSEASDRFDHSEE